MAAHLLGLDVGTSLIRAAVFDRDGRERGHASRKAETASPRPGWSEQDMAGVWAASAATIREALAASGVPASEIAAVGPSGQGDGAWLLDRAGQPLGPAPLWNDGRATGVVERWRSEGRLARLFARGGTVLWPGLLAPLLAWMREEEPERHARIATAFCCKDWIAFQLTGERGTDETDGSIPFMSMATRRIEADQAELLGLAGALPLLPPVRPSHAVAGAVTAAAAAVTGLREGTPVVAGMLDVAANAIGVGAIRAGQTMTILGTTALNAVVLGVPALDPVDVGATACHAVPGHWLRILGAMAGTPNLDWYLASMGEILGREAGAGAGEVYALMDDAVSASPVGAGGVLYHPFLRGERAPFLAPDARAGFFGIGAATTRADLARAVYEGVALAIRDCLEHAGPRDGTPPGAAIAQAGGEAGEVMLSGGGARSPVWCQILADVTGRAMSIPAGADFGALGAAIAAGVGVGLFEGYEDAVRRCVRVERRYHPRAGPAARYDGLYRLYRGLLGDLTAFWAGREQLVRAWEGDEGG